MLRSYNKYKKCIINCEEYISSNSWSQKSTAIAAKWPNVSGIDTQSTAHIRIGRIVSFIEHSVIVSSLSMSSTTKVHILARVHWYTDHPRTTTNLLIMIINHVYLI